MRRLVLLGLVALVALAPLAACGKKGDPEADPPRVKQQMPQQPAKPAQ